METPLLGTNVVTQIGILVNDIEKTSRIYAKFLGCEVPEWSMTAAEPLARTKYLGVPARRGPNWLFLTWGPMCRLN